MRENKIFYAVFGFILSLQLVSASPLQHYEAETEIMPDLSTSHKINLVFLNLTSETFNFFISQQAHNINVTTTAGAIPCTFTKKIIGTEILCDISGITAPRYSIVITYNSFDNVKKANGYFFFQETHKTPLDAKSMFFLVKIPEGFALIKEKNDTFPSILPYTPSYGSIGTDGRRIVIAWQKKDVKAGDGLDVSVAYESVTDYSSQLISIFTGSIIGLIFIIIFMGLVFWFVWRHFKAIRFVLPVLKKDEKIIIDILLRYQRQGKKGVNQKVIVKESNYSKAKVSKVLKSLAERGLVRLERLGRTNKVYLVERFKK